jgi:hypothetical protein
MSARSPAPSRAVRLLLALLACSAVVPGTWASVAPRSFYTTFPGAGHWIDSSGPFSEHLARDVGAFYLAFALMFVWAAYRPDPILVVPLCVGWATFSALHVVWHSGHLESFATGDAIAQTIGLLAVLALAAATVILERRRPGRVREPSNPIATPKAHESTTTAAPATDQMSPVRAADPAKRPPTTTALGRVNASGVDGGATA